MKTISILLKKDVDDEKRQSLLSRVAEHESCRSVSTAPRSSKSSVARRLLHARAEEEESAETLRAFIASQPEVEAAEIEAPRKIS